MDKRLRTGLLYKEYYMSKKYIRNTGFVGIMIAMVLFLPLLSFQYGNLRLLTGEDVEDVHNMMLIFAKYMPMIVFATLCVTNFEVSVKDEKAEFRRFLCATPVDGFVLAFHKFLFSFLLMCPSVMVAFFYLRGYDAIFGGNNIIGELGVMSAILCLVFYFEILMLIFGILLGSYDRAAIAVVVLVYGIFIIGVIFFMDKITAALGVASVDYITCETIEKLGEKIFSYSIIMLVVGFVAGIVLVGLTYKRREK